MRGKRATRSKDENAAESDGWGVKLSNPSTKKKNPTRKNNTIKGQKK
jgi:hypothetical protein